MTIPPLSLGIIKGAEWLKALHAEMFTYGQAHGYMNKNAEHTSVHALAGRLQAGPNGNLELTVPSSLIKGVFDALDEPGAEFVVRNNRTECAIKVMTKEEVDKLGGTSHITERGHSYHYTLGPIVELPATGDYDKLWAISIKSDDLEAIRRSYGLETSPQLGFYIPVGCKKKKVTEDNEVSKLASVHEYAANDPNMRILSQGPVTDRDFLYHASGKKFDSLDPSYNSKKSFGHEYNAPVVFAGDSPSSAFAANPTAEYQAVKDKIRNSVYHRLIDEQTGRKALLGHTPGGYLYKLPASAFTKIDREDNELGKWNKSTEYVSHMPVKPISVTPMQSTDVDAIPEYEYLGEDFVGEMPAQHYLNHAKDPKVIAAVKAWLGNKQEKLASDAEPKKELVRIKLDDNDGKSLTHHYLTAKKWDYPAGKVEPNEDRDDAAVRELRERTGHHIDKSKLKYNGHSDGFHQYSGVLSDVSKIDSAHYETGEPRQLSWKKEAGVYTASGDKVQGVGLRKMYHSLLEEQGLPGLGVNNEDTGDVELSFDGDEAKRQEVFNQLGSRVQAKTGHPVTFAPVDIPQSSVPVSLSNKDTERLNAIHHLAYRMSNMYDPADSSLDSNDDFKQKLADRFRLQVNQRGLRGTVPSRAAEQLLGTRPMYEGMMPARRTRSEEEALSDMAEEQKLRLMKALSGGRGFLAPNEEGVSKLASLLKLSASDLPWRDRVEVYTQNPKGKIYGGTWDSDKSFALPGGGIDEGEDPLVAALRELKEETGITAKNPRLLPIDPVDHPWSDAHRAKVKRNFAGSRTHFVLADAASRRGNKNLDVWNASNRGYYTPAEAIDIMNNNTNYTAPAAAAARLKALQHLQSLATAPSPVSKLASLLKKAEGEATPPPIEPISLPSHSPPSGMPAPSIPQGTDFNAMWDKWKKSNPKDVRGNGAKIPTEPGMPLYTYPSGTQRLGALKFDNSTLNNPNLDGQYTPGSYLAANISPGADSGPGHFRISAHGRGGYAEKGLEGQGGYEIDNPGNKGISLSPLYRENLPAFMKGQNPSTLMAQSCNSQGGCTPATYGSLFNDLKTPGTKTNLNKVVMTPPGYYATATSDPNQPEGGSAGDPYGGWPDRHTSLQYQEHGSPYHEYTLPAGRDATNNNHWQDMGIYTDARQSRPFEGFKGEALELTKHLSQGGNLKGYLDNVERINNNPDATVHNMVGSINARMGGSAAVAATRSIPEIISSIGWNNHLRAMQDRSQRKLSKTPAVQTPGLYPGVPIN